MCLAAGGCMVTSSKYEMKTKEADNLRDAVAAASKENAVLEARNEALRKQLADEKNAKEALAARAQAQEADLRRTGEELASARKNYEGTRITREQFISELLEKEKSTGKRIQELNARVQACEASLEAFRKEPGDGDSGPASPDGDALKRERDILLGRVERLTEERRQEEKRREDRFAALAEAIGKVSRDVSVTPMGPALSVALPDRILRAKGKAALSEGGKKVVTLVERAAAEFPSASILIVAGEKKSAGEIRTAIANPGKVPRERIHVKINEKEKGAELLLLVP
jgi:regulator of replication initiation timing